MTPDARKIPSPGNGGGSASRRCAAALLLAILFGAASAPAQDPFADGVHAYVPGTNGGFGDDALPDVLLGPPRGTGDLQGSFDVLALGIGGEVVLRFDLPVICDGPGPDFTVFENAFHSGSISGPLFTEYGYVAVSQNGIDFVQFPHDPETRSGLIGQTPVFSHPDNGIDPLDPSVSGGDAFDLATVGLSWAAYVRITDVAGAIPDFGDGPIFTVPPNAGLDLDAIAALHACDPNSLSTATPTFTPTAPATMPTATHTAVASASAAPTETPPPTMTATGAPTAAATETATAGPSSTVTAPDTLPGDADGNGEVDAGDLERLTAEIYDGDGDDAAAVGGGTVASHRGADVNQDGRIGAADLAALRRLLAGSSSE